MEDVEAVAITTDIWSSKQRYSYLGVTSHYFDFEVIYCNRTLATYPLPDEHTTVAINETLISILNDYKLSNKVVAIVTDNAKNVLKLNEFMNASLRRLQPENEIKRFGCTAHIINLIVIKLLNADSFSFM